MFHFAGCGHGVEKLVFWFVPLMSGVVARSATLLTIQRPEASSNETVATTQ
ncbi:MAG: hypothetical protein NTZ96_06730 [Burkholderiales bacterium]|nr:hypothetical protein [Burkholderiales bacterium]